MLPAHLPLTDTDANDVAEVPLSTRHRFLRPVAIAVISVSVLVTGAVRYSKHGDDEVTPTGVDVKLDMATGLNVGVVGKRRRETSAKPKGMNISEMTFGGDAGDKFDDYGCVGKVGFIGIQCWGIKKIEIKASDTISQLRITYASGQQLEHGRGGEGDWQEPFHVGEGEWIGKVKMVHGSNVNALQFFTNTGRSSVYAGDSSAHCLHDSNCKEEVYDASPNGIYSFRGRAGNVLHQLQFYTGFTSSSCDDILEVVGSWQPYYYNNGGFTVEVSMGTVTANEETRSEEWAASVSAELTLGFNYKVASGSMTVGSEFSYTLAEEYSSSFSHEETRTQTVSFDTGGQLWAWVFDTSDPCGGARTFKDYVMTRSLDQPPCCPAGWAADVYTQYGPCASGYLDAEKINGCIGMDQIVCNDDGGGCCPAGEPCRCHQDCVGDFGEYSGRVDAYCDAPGAGILGHQRVDCNDPPNPPTSPDYGKPMLDGGVMDQYVHQVSPTETDE